MKEFIKAALIRCIKTICQTAVATIGTAFVISDVDWKIVISASLLAGVLSILTSIATGLPEVEFTKELTGDEFEEFEKEDDDDDVE